MASWTRPPFRGGCAVTLTSSWIWKMTVQSRLCRFANFSIFWQAPGALQMFSCVTMIWSRSFCLLCLNLHLIFVRSYGWWWMGFTKYATASLTIMFSNHPTCLTSGKWFWRRFAGALSLRCVWATVQSHCCVQTEPAAKRPTHCYIGRHVSCELQQVAQQQDCPMPLGGAFLCACKSMQKKCLSWDLGPVCVACVSL